MKAEDTSVSCDWKVSGEHVNEPLLG